MLFCFFANFLYLRGVQTIQLNSFFLPVRGEMKSWECAKDACDMLVPLGTYYHLPLGIVEQDT